MSKKEKFINVVEDLFRKTDMQVFAGDDYEDVMTYFEAIKICNNDNSDKPQVTKIGKTILIYMREKELEGITIFKSKDFEPAGLSSRTVAGSIKKLVADGFCEKLGENPSVYSLTDKGKNIDFSLEE